MTAVGVTVGVGGIPMTVVGDAVGEHASVVTLAEAE